ncbi:MAG: discoidin domain-containing protein [Thermoguttaceae bacterium]|nr:discoidin domain-containing protein [Thermoguttaceae bacterium]
MSNSQDRFSFFRLLTCGGIAFLLLGLLLSSSAQADLIYAVRVNALNAAGTNNYRENNEKYSNYNFSTTDNSASTKWCTQTNGSPYSLDDGSATPIMLCDLGSVQTINAIYISPYDATSNIVKALKVEFYDSPAINATPVYTQTFTGIPQSAKTLTLTNPTNARFVKITMTQNYNGNRYGVGNVMFDVERIRPETRSVNVATHPNYSVEYLFDNNTSTQWVTDDADTDKGYFGGSFPNPVFTFTFDSAQTFTGIGVNGYNVSGNSIKNFNLDFYDASGTKISVDDPSKYSFTMTHYTNTNRDDFWFPSVENVSKIEMTLTGNFRGTGNGGDRVGLSEVFFTNTPEPEAPTTPVVYNAPLFNDNALVRPNAASFLTPGAERASARDLSYLYDGTASAPGGNEWYTIDTKVGNNVIPDYYTVGYTPVIEFTMPSEAAYDSFSIWGYNTKGNLMSDFTLELYDSNGKLVYADEYLIENHIDKSHYATFSFGQNYVFQKAVLTALDNGYNIYGGAGGDRVGFTEIAFYQEPYYFANSPDISADSWTIDGTTKKGVRFVECDDQTATFNNSVNLNADGTFEIGEGKNLTLAGAVSGDYGFEKTGKGTLTLSGANTYTGMTTVTEGALQLTGDAVQTSGPITVETDGTLEYNIPSGQTEKTTITADNAIVSDGKVIKTGEGTLKIDSAEGSVDVQSLVVSSGRLDMKSYFKGALIIGEELGEGQYTTATFSPGNSIGTLTVDGDFVLNPGSTLLMEIGGQSADENDKLIVSGDFEIADGAIIYLELADMGAFSTGDTFEALIQAGSADDDYTDAISSAIVPGWPFYDLSVTKSGNEYSIHGVYDPNAVPEPSTWALMALGVVGLMYWRKRK